MVRGSTTAIGRLVPMVLMVALAAASRAGERGEPLCTLEDGAEIEVDGRTFLEMGTTLVELASASMGCLSCHDGTVAPGILNTPRQFRAGQKNPSEAFGYDHGDPSRNHPVDVPYPVAAPGYTPRNLLDSRLQLDNGLVTCRTCHGGRPAGGGVALSIPNEGSQLCFACHDM